MGARARRMGARGGGASRTSRGGGRTARRGGGASRTEARRGDRIGACAAFSLTALSRSSGLFQPAHRPCAVGCTI